MPEASNEDEVYVTSIVGRLAACWPSESLAEDAVLPDELMEAHEALNRAANEGHAGLIARTAAEVAAYQLLTQLHMTRIPDDNDLGIAYTTGVNPAAAQMALSWVMSAAKHESGYRLATLLGGFHHTIAVYIQALFDLIAALRDKTAVVSLTPSAVEDVEVSGEVL